MVTAQRCAVTIGSLCSGRLTALSTAALDQSSGLVPLPKATRIEIEALATPVGSPRSSGAI
jgi:hypothetical protein